MKQKRIRINLEDTEGAKFKFDIELHSTLNKVIFKKNLLLKSIYSNSEVQRFRLDENLLFLKSELLKIF